MRLKSSSASGKCGDLVISEKLGSRTALSLSADPLVLVTCTALTRASLLIIAGGKWDFGIILRQHMIFVWVRTAKCKYCR